MCYQWAEGKRNSTKNTILYSVGEEIKENSQVMIRLCLSDLESFFVCLCQLSCTRSLFLECGVIMRVSCPADENMITE